MNLWPKQMVLVRINKACVHIGYKVKNAMTLTYASIDTCGTAKDMGTGVSYAAY